LQGRILKEEDHLLLQLNSATRASLC